jgi:drug/metabolite transporter (DMT)-like permease
LNRILQPDRPSEAKPALRRYIWACSVLLVMGASWGLSFSLGRIAATLGAHPLGIIFWESFIAGSLLFALMLARRRAIRLTRPFLRLYTITAIVGMVVPGTLFFYAASRVPAGILSLTVAIVPLVTFIASLVFGLDKFSPLRVLGVILGIGAVALLVGPQESLPDPAQLPWVLVAFLAAMGYAAMNIILATLSPPGADAFASSCGMFLTASLILVPAQYFVGGFVPFAYPWGALEWSLFGLGAINAVAFGLFVYLIDYAGPVFGSMTANAVTLFGIVWGIIIFGEQNSVWVWLSLATMMAALTLVSPRGKAAQAAENNGD